MPASPSSTKRVIPARPSDLSSAVSSSQTPTRQGVPPIFNSFAGPGIQNNPNGTGPQIIVYSATEVEAPPPASIPQNLPSSSSLHLPSLRKQINNTNLGRGVQSNNNKSGTQYVSQTREDRRRNATITAPRRSDRPGVSLGRGPQTEINNTNRDLGVQNNNDHDGSQYVSPDVQDHDGSTRVALPSQQMQGPSPGSEQWDRQINNWNEGEGSQNNNNGDGTQHVHAPRKSPHSNYMSSPPTPRIPGLGQASTVINNWNSGRGIQNNNNDSGTQYVHWRNKQDARVTKTLSDCASAKRGPPSSSAGSESGRDARQSISKPVVRKRWV